MEGTEASPCLAWLLGAGPEIPFNSAHIFILNDRYPRAGIGRAKAKWHRRAGNAPGPNQSNHGATEFNISKKLFSFSPWRGSISFQQRWRPAVMGDIGGGGGGKKRRTECGGGTRGCMGDESGREGALSGQEGVRSERK